MLSDSRTKASNLDRTETMTEYARKPWTAPQIALGAACGFLGVAIAVLGFTDIFLTVTRLLSQWWGGWSWTVIVLGEGSFTGCYCGWLLLDLRDHAPRKVAWFLACYLASFAAVSLSLNLYAGRHGFPDAASHVIVVAAFFGYLMFAKVLVRRLSADPAAVALAVALADARQYAVDLCRSVKGPLWRWRVPALLRRHILTGRLCDSVRDDVRARVEAGSSSGWESAIREWVLGPAGLHMAVQAQEQSRIAREGIVREASQVPVQGPPAVAVEVPAEVPAGSTPQRALPAGRQSVPESALRKVLRTGGRKATDDDVRAAIRELFADGRPVTKYRVVKELKGPKGGIGDDRAGQLLAEVQAERPDLHVMGG